MKKEELIKSIGQIDEKFILEADEAEDSAELKEIKASAKNRKSRRGRYISVAAAFAVVIGAGIMAFNRMDTLMLPNMNGSSSGSNAPVASENQSGSSFNKSEEQMQPGMEGSVADKVVLIGLKLDYDESMTDKTYSISIEEGAEALVILENELGNAELEITGPKGEVLAKESVSGSEHKELSFKAVDSGFYTVKLGLSNAKGKMELKNK